MSFLREYFIGIKTELKHVNWPNRRDVTTFTVVVIVLSIVGAAYLGFFDFLFSFALKYLLA